MKLVALAAVVFLAAGCPKPAPHAPPLDGPHSCAAACEGLIRSGCREGDPTPAGLPCESVCATSSGARRWPLGCWAGSSSREDVLACGSARCAPSER